MCVWGGVTQFTYTLSQKKNENNLPLHSETIVQFLKAMGKYQSIDTNYFSFKDITIFQGEKQNCKQI